MAETLQDMGYLNKRERNLYELGARVISDGFGYLGSRDIVEIALPHLNALRDSTSLSCHLSIREHTEVLYIYRAFAPQRLMVNIPVGTRLPCHVTALGRMLLTGLDEEALAQLYQQVRLDDYPSPAPRTLLELQQTIADDRQRGWVLHRSDYSTAIATTIRDRTGQVVAAINLSGPEAVLARAATEQRYVQRLRETAEAIAGELLAR